MHLSSIQCLFSPRKQAPTLSSPSLNPQPVQPRTLNPRHPAHAPRRRDLTAATYPRITEKTWPEALSRYLSAAASAYLLALMDGREVDKTLGLPTRLSFLEAPDWQAAMLAGECDRLRTHAHTLCVCFAGEGE